MRNKQTILSLFLSLSIMTGRGISPLSIHTRLNPNKNPFLPKHSDSLAYNLDLT